jgi:Phosphodiester glycosidase
MRKFFNLFVACLLIHSTVFSQIKWQNVDSLYNPLPASIHIYTTNSKIDTGNFRAFYLVADLKDKQLNFTADTTFKRRFTPSKFYEKNDKPLVVVNCTFFSFETNKNLNVVVKNKKLVGYNIHTIAGKGKDTLTYKHPFGSALGISQKRKADVAWTYTDSLSKYVLATQTKHRLQQDSFSVLSPHSIKSMKHTYKLHPQKRDFNKSFYRWKMNTAIGGGPVLLQEGEISITNNEELKFTGKAINDKHPRTAMGYTKDNKLIILVIEGRNPGIADGATLIQEAEILKNIGCWEALNLDGGGSSCLLVNGKESIKVSDKTGQRPVPAVFLIHKK